MTRRRLDLHLVASGHAPTRSRARDLIRRGCVTLAGSVVTKAGHLVDPDERVAISDGASPFVSRGGLKLCAGLEHFGFDPAGRITLDIGASTGGFADALLARGAARVYAVDVGRDQLAPSLRADPRVVSLEGCDARDLDPSRVPDPIGAIVADVSFISLTLALPASLGLAATGAWLVALVKPQFEAGRDAVGKGGIVRDDAARAAAVDKVRCWLAEQQGWRVEGCIASPVTGSGGNQEFLLGAVKHG